ncbi:prepilin peptidase [Chthonobacter rhizosphaerae]|uniref:prepilin peptidase n=1 Tax=Chthonobacter rhizosphaerae TaxID=2735553 RepID=UPI0015EF23C7|nr:prepilin peptidase [Chthonobacter rhizosphaerae]
MDWLHAPILDPAAAVLAVACAFAAAVVDHRHGVIPNRLTYSVLLAGLALAAATGGIAGLGSATAGLLAAAAVFVVAFAAGSCGGGDVKLMAALGTVVGFPVAVDLTLAALMAGGVLAVAAMLRRLDLAWLVRSVSLFVLLMPAGLKTAASSMAPAERRTIRFGVAAAAGLVWILLLPEHTPLSFVR